MELRIKNIFGVNPLTQILNFNNLFKVLLISLLFSCSNNRKLSDKWSIVYNEVGKSFDLDYISEGIIYGFNDYVIIENNNYQFILKCKFRNRIRCFKIIKDQADSLYGKVPNEKLYTEIKCKI